MSSPLTDIGIGPFVDRELVEQSTMAHLQAWMTPYIASIERGRQLAPRSIALPSSWSVVNQLTRFPEESLPWIAVVSTGTHGGRKPQRDGDGSVMAWWIVAVGAVVAASDPAAAKALAGYYGVAIRLIMGQKPSLGGWANTVEWEEEQYDEFGRSQERNLAGVRSVFTIGVSDAMNVYGANPKLPSDPSSDQYAPPPQYPTVQTANVNIERMP